MKNISVEVTNQDARNALVSLCKSVNWADERYCGGNYIDNSQSYPFFLLDERGGGFCSSGYSPVSFEEMIRTILEDKPISFKLNDEYEAVVKNDGTVTVGCQTFSKDTILELARIVSNPSAYRK